MLCGTLDSCLNHCWLCFARADSEGKHDKVAWGKFVHFNSKYKIHSTIRDELGRYIVTDTEFLNRRMALGNVYGSEFFEEVSIVLHLLIIMN